jgi:hypothetical protein
MAAGHWIKEGTLFGTRLDQIKSCELSSLYKTWHLPEIIEYGAYAALIHAGIIRRCPYTWNVFLPELEEELIIVDTRGKRTFLPEDVYTIPEKIYSHVWDPRHLPGIPEDVLHSVFSAIKLEDLLGVEYTPKSIPEDVGRYYDKHYVLGVDVEPEDAKYIKVLGAAYRLAEWARYCKVPTNTLVSILRELGIIKRIPMSPLCPTEIGKAFEVSRTGTLRFRIPILKIYVDRCLKLSKLYGDKTGRGLIGDELRISYNKYREYWKDRENQLVREYEYRKDNVYEVNSRYHYDTTGKIRSFNKVLR